MNDSSPVIAVFHFQEPDEETGELVSREVTFSFASEEAWEKFPYL